jgi:WD40 repeat protein
VKAFRTDNDFDTRDSLLSALEQSPQLITLLRGHGGGLNAPEVHDIAFHPNGHILASAGEDRRVILWDVETRRLRQELVRHPDNAIRRIAFSPDGEYLATLGFDGAWVWRVSDGSEITKLHGQHGELASLAFSPDGKSLATGDCIKASNRACVEGQLMLWDAHSGQPLRAPLIGHTGWVTSVAFHPNGQVLASASSDGTVQLWNPLTGQRIGNALHGHTSAVSAVAFSPDGKMLAFAGADRMIHLWNSSTRQPQGDPLNGHAGAVTSVAFSPDGTLLASGSEDQTVRLWDVSTGKPVGEPIRGHRDTVNAVVFSPKGQLLASGGGDNIVMLADFSAGSPIAVPLDGLARGSAGLVFSPDGKLLASGSSTGVIKVWDVAQRRQYGKWVVAQGSREIRDQSGRVIGFSSSHLFIESLAFHPNGKLLVSGSLDGLLELRDVATGQQIGRSFRHPGEVRAVAFSPDGKMVASVGSRATVVLWDAELQQPIATLKGHRTEEPGVNAPQQLDVYSVAFSPDGKMLASGSFDKSIILWDVAAKKPLRPPLAGHQAWVDSIAFRPDGRVLASADVAGVILFWDTVTGQLLGSRLRMPKKGYTRIAYGIFPSTHGRLVRA